MKRVVVCFLFFIFTFTPLFSMEVIPEFGVSNFRYGEVGINNKDDLYTITSFLGGLNVGFSIEEFSINLISSFQIPFSLKMSDALGSDERNYLYYLIFFGGSFKGEVKYEFDLGNGFSISPLIICDYNIFYFKDNVIGETDEYYFSTIGLGSGAQFSYISEKNILFNVKFYVTKNIWPVPPIRVGEFIGSDSIGFTLGIGKRF